MFGWTRKPEARNMENPAVPVSSQTLVTWLYGDGMSNSSGEVVTIETALGVPAIWQAVNFLSGTIAGLPLLVFRKSSDGRKRVTDALAEILQKRVNDEPTSSFEWRKYTMEQVLTGGRGLTYIERNAGGKVIALWPLDPMNSTVRRVNGRKVIEYRDASRTVTYEASEVIDIPAMLKADRVTARSPIITNREVVAMAQAMTKYGGSYFRNGGVPPFAVTGNFQSGKAMDRAADDLAAAVRKAAKEQRQALVMPSGLDIKPIGADPQKSQMIEAQRFVIEQIARIYNLPPVFLQDMTHGTYSNTEQQDLQLVKHTVKRWVEQFEQELNLKLFPKGSNLYCEFAMDGLLRGDFMTRMQGYAAAIQNGVLKPGEAREFENRERADGDDLLYMQGAMVPISKAGQQAETGLQNDA
jgi:HK97 family phage portal protein